MRSLFHSCVLALLCGFSFYACKSEKEISEELEKLSVTTPDILDTVFTKKYVCQIRSIQHIELRALEKGYIQKVLVDEGQLVHKGICCSEFCR